MMDNQSIGCDTCYRAGKSGRCKIPDPHDECLFGEVDIGTMYPDLGKYGYYQYSMWKPRWIQLPDELFEI